MEKQIKKDENVKIESTNSDVKTKEEIPTTAASREEIKSEKTETETDTNSASAAVVENEKDPLLNMFYSEVILHDLPNFIDFLPNLVDLSRSMK